MLGAMLGALGYGMACIQILAPQAHVFLIACRRLRLRNSRTAQMIGALAQRMACAQTLAVQGLVN